MTGSVPVADWLDQRAMLCDPYPSYGRLRDLGPVVHAPGISRHVLTTHAAVLLAEQNPEAFSANPREPDFQMKALGGHSMLRKDDPAHGVERGAINPTLRPKTITDVWSPDFERTVQHWLDYLASVDQPDLNRDFAAPVAAQNLIDLVGFDQVEGISVEAMRRWSFDFIDGIANIFDDQAVWDRCARSGAEVDAILDELIPWLRHSPNRSITSHLIEAGLPEQLVRVNVKLAISGGMNEPQHMITSMVWALDAHPEQRAAVIDDHSLFGQAFEETARWISPIGMLPRLTTRDVEAFGTTIPAGTLVGLLLASANRDASVFDGADRFDILRNARSHLAFGSGVHMCAGRWAAKRSISELAVPQLYERFPDLGVDPTRETTWEGWVFRGLTALPVTL